MPTVRRDFFGQHAHYFYQHMHCQHLYQHVHCQYVDLSGRPGLPWIKGIHNGQA